MIRLVQNNNMYFLREPYEKKVQRMKSITRTSMRKHNGNVYVSFSGGIDSTVLTDVAAQVAYEEGMALNIANVNTGIEYPEVQTFVVDFMEYLTCKYPTLDIQMSIIKPNQSHKDFIMENGYPIISKEQCQFICELRETKSERLRDIRLNGNKYGMGKVANKYLYLVYEAPFKITYKCCPTFKLNPLIEYEKDTGLVCMVGTTASESLLRRTKYMKHGFVNKSASRLVYKPLSAFNKNDVLMYLYTNHIPYSAAYGMIIPSQKGFCTSACDRTGCFSCLYGIQYEQGANRMERLRKSHPDLYEYCIYEVEYNKVLDYLGIRY